MNIREHLFSSNPLEVVEELKNITKNTRYGTMGMISMSPHNKSTQECMKLIEKCVIPFMEEKLKKYGDTICGHVVIEEFRLAVTELVFHISSHFALFKPINLKYEKVGEKLNLVVSL